MSFDYSKLSGLIREKCHTRAVFADKIGLSSHSLSLKMNGKLQWKQTEICKACEILNIENENIPIYFFNSRVQTIEQFEAEDQTA